MMPFIKSGANQIIHTCINNAEGLSTSLFLVETTRQHYPSVTDNVAPRLEQNLETTLLEHWHHSRSILLNGQRLVLLFLSSPPVRLARLQGGVIHDTYTSTDGEKLNAVGLLEADGKWSHLLHRLDERLQRSQLRANVHL